MGTELKVAGGGLIVWLLFIVTIYFLEIYSDPHAANEKRISDVAALKTAIERYRKDLGNYPIRSGISVDELEEQLVKRGYLKEIPGDPLRDAGVFQYQYASDGQSSYAILVRLSREKTMFVTRAEGYCVAGFRAPAVTAWGQLEECQF